MTDQKLDASGKPRNGIEVYRGYSAGMRPVNGKDVEYVLSWGSVDYYWLTVSERDYRQTVRDLMRAGF